MAVLKEVIFCGEASGEESFLKSSELLNRLSCSWGASMLSWLMIGTNNKFKFGFILFAQIIYATAV